MVMLSVHKIGIFIKCKAVAIYIVQGNIVSGELLMLLRVCFEMLKLDTKWANVIPNSNIIFTWPKDIALLN